MNKKGRLKNPSVFKITSRLQKGGALIPDMRLMVSAWSEDLDKRDPVPVLARAIPKLTVARVKDTYIRAFRPRFIKGSPPEAWRLARVLEDVNADTQVIYPFYFWITARCEKPMYDFMTDVIFPQSRSANRDVRVEDAASWLTQQIRIIGKTWTPTVTLKVARGMLAALRDFGILEGTMRKRIAATSLLPEAFALIAFCLHDMGLTGRELVKNLDWRLFLLGENGVEHLFLECHQHGWLRFEMAGNLRRTDFPSVSFKEFAIDVLS